MDFDALEGFDVERGVIDVWKAEFGRSLLPIQERAVRGGLLTGKNLIVFAPTSAGKTAIGEMAAVKAARDGRRVFYLVPLKALAREKYQEFRRRYGPLGLEVVVSSRDHSQFDERIVGGQFRIAVCTFEKLWALLVSHPALAQTIGLVVVDELQMLADPERGGTLELLLTRMKRSVPEPQIVGLSAVLEQSEGLAHWLGAQRIAETHRPVELRKGVLLNGLFHYVEHNSGLSGTERFFDWRAGASAEEDERAELALLGIRHLAETLGQPTIVFVPDRAGTVSLARKCLPLLALPAASRTIESLGSFEDCEAKEALGELLAGGVAFHHADLTQEYRTLVETGFRDGGIRILFSTPTLAMGVNLPARNVLILPRKWRRDPRHGWIAEPLTRMEFENFAGRAARLGFGDGFGRAVVPETSAFEKDLLFDRYLRAPFESLKPALSESRMEEAVLALAASGVARTREECDAFIGATLAGPVLVDRARTALERMLQLGLVEDRRGVLTGSDLGHSLARRGILPESGLALSEWARGRTAAEDLEVLLAVAGTPDGQDCPIPLSRRAHLEQHYDLLLRRHLPGHALLSAEHALSFEETITVKKAFIALDWIDEHPLASIEQDHQVWGGSVERLTEDLGWLVEAFSEIAGYAKWDAEAQNRVRLLARRLRAGVRAELLPLSTFRTGGLNRRQLRSLHGHGLLTMESVTTAGEQELARVVGPAAATALLRHLEGHEPDPAPTRKRETGCARIVLLGEARSHGRATILVDGVERLVSRRHFELLYGLSGGDWLPLSEVGGDMDTARKELLRLRRKLATFLRLTPPEVLASDGRKRYRLLVSLRLDRAALRRHQPDLATSQS